MDLCLFAGSGWTLKAVPPTAVYHQLTFASAHLQARVISTESVRECWLGWLEEVREFLLLRWRFVALITADADYIIAV